MGLAEAWENSMLTLWERGCAIRTEYDPKDQGGNYVFPPSKDSTMIVTVLNPMVEPHYHRAFPGGLEDLQEYILEVTLGIKDHWMKQPDPNGTKWKYTYHDRLTRYPYFHAKPDDIGDVCFGQIGYTNQLQAIADKLAKSPHSRRVQGITWQVWSDNDIDDPPCLQSVWCRVWVDPSTYEWWLCMNVRFRSRDAYDAAFMNMVAMIALQQKIAAEIGRLSGHKVRLGRYCDLSDSYHIYGTRLQHFEDNFLKLHNTRSWEERTWTREFADPIMASFVPQIMAKVQAQDAKYE
jgi:thymidylate synthase